MSNGTRISDEYAAAIVDTRSRIHLEPELSMTLQIPQYNIAEALVEHWGCGEIDTYRSPANGRRFNHVVVKGPELPRILRSVRPYLLSLARGGSSTWLWRKPTRRSRREGRVIRERAFAPVLTHKDLDRGEGE